MHRIRYCLYREDHYFVAQCLNVDVSSFGETKEEAVANLKEALELYFEDGDGDYQSIEEATIGEEVVYA